MNVFNKKWAVIVCISILIILSSTQITNNKIVNACTSAILLNPTSTAGPPPDVGGAFNLTLNVTGQAELWSWKTDLKWDPLVLDLQSVTEGPFLKSEGTNTDFSSGEINHSTGSLSGVSETRLVQTGIAGSGVLATFNFKVVGYSASASTIQIVSDELHSSANCHPLIQHTTNSATFTLPPPSPPPNNPPTPHNPVAIISSPAKNSIFYAGTPIHLDGSQSQGGQDTNGVRPITSWNWTITGAYTGKLNGATQLITPTIPGTITIQLTVTAPASITPTTGYNPVNTTSVTVYVQRLEYVNRDTTSPNRDTTPPVVIFTISGLDKYNTTTIHKTLTFNASKSYDPNNGIIKSYLWEFSDGTFANGVITDHIYSVAGNYTVKLTCTDASGNSAWKTASIKIIKPKIDIDLYTINESGDGKGHNSASGPFEPYSKINLFTTVKIQGFPAQNISVTYIVRGPASLRPFMFDRVEQTNQNGTALLTFRLPAAETPEETGVFGNWTVEAYIVNFDEKVGDKMSFIVDWAVDLGSAETSLRILDSQNQPVSILFNKQSATIEIQLLNQFKYRVNENLTIQVFDHGGDEIFQKRLDNYYFKPGINTLDIPLIIPDNAVSGNTTTKLSIIPFNYDLSAYIPSRTFDTFKIITIRVNLVNGMLSEKSIYEGDLLNMTILIENSGEIASDATIRINCNQTQAGVINTQVFSKSVHIITYSWNTTNYQPGVYIISASIDNIPYNIQSGNTTITLGNAEVKYQSNIFIVHWFGLIEVVTAVATTVTLVSFFKRDLHQPKT